MRIRFRVDGVLHEPMRPQPKNLQGGLISRLKVMADLNIAEKRVPQDGRISMKVGTRQLDMRVATLPTVHGEKVVIRVLDKSNAMLDLADLGFLEDSYDRFATAFSKPYGAILVTGPTGSGKSTTMYSTLNILNEESKNIITVEDPGRVPDGRRQSDPGQSQGGAHVRLGAAIDPARRPRHRPDRGDPGQGDGHDRDRGRPDRSPRALLLHTNDAPSAISRLVEMDVETFLVASSIDAVVAQRLARILCDKCKQPYARRGRAPGGRLRGGLVGGHRRGLPGTRQPDREERMQGLLRHGLPGRIGLYEVMLRSEEIERLTVERASADAIRTVIQQGMTTCGRTVWPRSEQGSHRSRKSRGW